jgi:hypothetical protein
MTIKNKNNRNKPLLFATIATLAIGFVMLMIENTVVGQASQDELEYGSVYDCGAGRSKFKVVSCEGVEDMDRCKVQTLRSADPNSIVHEDNWYRKGVMDHLAAGCKPKNRPKQLSEAEPRKSPPNETERTDETRTANASTGKARKFKVGDRVMASPAMLKEDKYYQPCTVIKEMKPNAYYLMCDPHNGISFQDFTVREDFVRAWGNATAAPKIECLFNEPTGIVTKTAPASAALFKRMIYEKEAAANHRTKVGVTFETFQMGKPYKNIISGRRLLHEFLPQNTTIYPIKTRFVTCVQGKEFNSRVVIETCYDCAKDKFGEWTCGPGCGAAKFLERHSIPNLSHFFGNQ